MMVATLQGNGYAPFKKPLLFDVIVAHHLCWILMASPQTSAISDHLLTTNRLINSENNGQKQPHINNHQKNKNKAIADTLEILGR